MASNFQIYSLKTKNSLHLKLAGDFDGSSAYELINTLTEHSQSFYEIFIDISDLNT
jgi:anti-anti-sigma regulatory factor